MGPNLAALKKHLIYLAFNFPGLRQFKEVKNYILGRLGTGLPAHLSYHNVDHTLDVLDAAEMLADQEGIPGPDKELLLTAALFHDTGFLEVRDEHEAASCGLAHKYLPAYGYHPDEVDRLCNIIMATRLPQSPACKLAEILCDADLDYLGRGDFFPLSQNLFKELLSEGLVKDEEDWNQQQADFMGNHRYFTKTAIHLRTAMQQHHVEQITAKITTRVFNENQ
jgi:predicted metal-dependent HD superfamily phosphohydrolase